MLASSPDMDTIVVRSTHPLEAGASPSPNYSDQASINLFETAMGEIPDTLQLSFTTVPALRRKLRTIIQRPRGQNGMTTPYVSVSGVLEETIDTVVNPLRNRIAVRVWWEGNNSAAIIKLMPGAEHEFSIRRFATNLFFEIAEIPGHNQWSVSDTGSTVELVY